MALSVPFPRGVNSTYSPESRVPWSGGSNVPNSDGPTRSTPLQRVGWSRKGNRNVNGFGGAVSNPDVTTGSSLNLRSPQATGAVIGPGPGGDRMQMGGFGRMMK